jgi:hypothetical protein
MDKAYSARTSMVIRALVKEIDPLDQKKEKRCWDQNTHT